MSYTSKPFIYLTVATFLILLCAQVRLFWSNGRFLSAFSTSYTASALDLASQLSIHPPHHNPSADNSTLGFQKILTLSRGTPWRIHGLLAAADYTNMSITIPPEPPIVESRVSTLQTAGSSEAHNPSRGQAIAWSMHLTMLRHIIMAGYETALILEDDVDWSVDLKSQITKTAAGVRQLVRDSPYADNFAPDPDADPNDTTPWAARSSAAWDVLWLGHCGEHYDAADEKLTNETVSWPDDTSVPRERYLNAYPGNPLDALPKGHRSVFPTRGAICSFGYAVTRRGAEKLLVLAEEVADEAYDVTLLRSCQQGSDRLRCLSVVDELFRHYRPAKEFGESSDIAEVGHEGEGQAQVEETVPGATENILKSARCEVLFGTTCDATAPKEGKEGGDGDIR